jgi:hypothetical protein
MAYKNDQEKVSAKMLMAAFKIFFVGRDFSSSSINAPEIITNTGTAKRETQEKRLPQIKAAVLLSKPEIKSPEIWIITTAHTAMILKKSKAYILFDFLSVIGSSQIQQGDA